MSVASLACGIASGATAKIAPEDILKGAIEVFPFGILIVQPGGQIIFASSELERMFGYARDELVGQTVDVLVPTNLRVQHAEHRRNFAVHPEMRKANSRNLSGRRKDGSELQVEIGLNPIQAGDGALVLAVISDISDRTRIESLKDEFVATVSHELRTPLTSIAGALGLLIGHAGGNLPGPAVRLLTIAHANSQRLVRLVNNILDMEKIESGKVVFVLKRVEVRALVTQAIESNRGFAEEYGVRIKLDAASTSGDIRADSDWLTQIVTNLLSNAIKFSPRGEEVVVAIKTQGDKVLISVRDHGHGVPDEFKPRIFEKFAQADNSDARQQGGTGLGLSIVKQIAERLGGTVRFDDAPGGGAIFSVEIPGWQQGRAALNSPVVPEHEPEVLR
ncbi:MAG: sensor hybrid histidine kinase [Xanthobacteraceae bacterium]|nr:sensor hybrid histidine kinase [Xanthobacteraceae bacterium]